MGILCAGLWITQGGRILWPRPEDDAYYYYIVASNLAHGHGLTLDWINWTNGFHPLWFLLILPIFAVAGLGSGAPVLAVQILSIVLYAASVALLADTLLRAGLRKGAVWILAILSLFGPFANNTSAGMEGAIVFPILALIIRHLLRQPSLLNPADRLLRPRDGATLGILLGLLMLARLDCVFQLLAVAAFVFYRGLTSPGRGWARLTLTLRRSLLIFLPVCLIVGTYLFWNLHHTGHLAPISGVLKTSFPFPAHKATKWLDRYPHWFALLLPLALWGIISLFTKEPRSLWQYGAVLRPLITGVFFHTAYILIFCKWAVHGWYFVQYIPITLVTAALGLNSLSELLAGKGVRPKVFLAFAGLTAAFLVAASLEISVRKVTLEGFRTVAYDAALMAKRRTPPGALFAMTDCGVFTYYSGRRCINLDGIISSWQFQSVLASNRLPQYFRCVGVNYLVVHLLPRQQDQYRRLTLTFPSRLYGERSSTIDVTRDQEVYRSPAYDDESKVGFLAVWQLSAPAKPARASAIRWNQ